ncbi:Spc98 family-domain-containing protein [Tricladium varicosporioides]|nr:Spc98 family-domain-containing protein [Hymenoscyphus varicosporioides]
MSSSVPVPAQGRELNDTRADLRPHPSIPKVGSRNEKQQERERDQVPGDERQSSSECLTRGPSHRRPNPSLKQSSGAIVERISETSRTTTRKTLVLRHRNAEHGQQTETRTKANVPSDARPNDSAALQSSWNPIASLIPQTTAPLAIRISVPPLASQAPKFLQPTSLHKLTLEGQEAAILEDLLSVLMGYEGQYIRFAKSYNNALEHNRIAGPGFSISPGLDRGLHDITTSILKIATHYIATEAFIEAQSRAEFGLVNHALCAAIRKLLHDYLVLIGQLETQFLTNSAFTLHVLSLHILPASRLMFQVYTLAHDISLRNALLKDQDSDNEFDDDENDILLSLQQGGDIGSTRFCMGGSILTLLTQRLEIMAGDPTARSLLSSLLNEASRPYMMMLNQWLHHGIVKDPHSEFMIREQQSIRRERLEEDYTDEYWDRRYTIRHDIPPQLEAVKAKILLAGKYLKVVRECRRVDTKAITDSPASFGDVRFLENVNNAYSRANEYLLQLLLTTYSLPMRFHSLKHYFILQSDFLSSFLELGASELRKPADKVNMNKLQSLLDLVVRQPGSLTAQDPFKEDVKVEMNPISLIDSLTRVVNISGEQSETLPPPAAQLEPEKAPVGYTSLQLDYIVAFPVSLVIGRKTIWRYQVLFRYLLSLRHLEQQLVFNWQTQNRTSCWSYKSSNTKLEIWKRHIFALRARMLAFVQQLLSFCTSEVIESNWQAFMKKLAVGEKTNFKTGIRTVDELMQDHVDFLDTCLKECMLTNGRLLKRHSKIARTCTLFALFTERFSRELEKGDTDLSDSGQLVTVVKRFELHFGKHLQLLLDELNYFAATESAVLLGLCARLSTINHSTEFDGPKC